MSLPCSLPAWSGAWTGHGEGKTGQKSGQHTESRSDARSSQSGPPPEPWELPVISDMLLKDLHREETGVTDETCDPLPYLLLPQFPQ